MNYLKFLFFSCILFILALGFHYPVQIVDAQSSLPAEGFSLQISFWRILFEPFLGWLFYYARANQPLTEMGILLIWFILGRFVFIARKNARRINNWRKTGFISFKTWFTELPILIGIWISTILSFMVVPCPFNTIVNKNPDKILVNLHSHSYFSHDGIISPKTLLEWHRQNSFDVFFVTEHNHHKKTLEIIDQQNNGKLASSSLIMCGQEYSGSNHLLLLGLTHHFNTKDWADSTAIRYAQNQGGIGIVAHWYADQPRPLQYYIECGVDGFEIANQAEGIWSEPEQIRQIKTICQENQLLMVGGCDYHGYGNPASVWNAFNIHNWKSLTTAEKRKTILNILKNRDQTKINVLLYKDRTPVRHAHIYLSPVYHFISYFRSLQLPQVLSWIGWIFLFVGVQQNPFTKNIINHFAQNSRRNWGFSGIAASSIMIIVGIAFLFKASQLQTYNKILNEYGIYLTVTGIIFWFYSLLRLKKTGSSEF